jgi:hypothetical protein
MKLNRKHNSGCINGDCQRYGAQYGGYHDCLGSKLLLLSHSTAINAVLTAVGTEWAINTVCAILLILRAIRCFCINLAGVLFILGNKKAKNYLDTVGQRIVN